MGAMRAAKRVGRYLRKAPVAWQGFFFHDTRPEELLCYADADWASDKTSRRSTSGGRRDSWWWSSQLLGEETEECRTFNLGESELFLAITSGTRSLGIQSELMDLGYNCSVTVVTDSQIVIDHSPRRGHSGWSERTLVAGSSGQQETGA